jgi:hypothetical protein
MDADRSSAAGADAERHDRASLKRAGIQRAEANDRASVEERWEAWRVAGSRRRRERAQTEDEATGRRRSPHQDGINHTAPARIGCSPERHNTDGDKNRRGMGRATTEDRLTLDSHQA